MGADLIKKCLAMVVGQDQCTDQYDVATFALAKALTPVHREQLLQLVKNGPVWDGDVISKSHRSDLLDWGLASRACVKGEQGYTVANYRGWDVHKAIAERDMQNRVGVAG